MRAQKVEIITSDNIKHEFDIGFDDKIPEETRMELRKFVSWVENNFNVPVTLSVDFEFRYYLLSRNKKRVGYLFNWSDFKNYPNFDDKNDIPVIQLPVRTEKSTINDILGSFIEAITEYFTWICNEISEENEINQDDVDEILDEYIKFCKEDIH